MPLTSFELGKLRIVTHVREELVRAGIEAERVHCKSGGIQTPPDIARLTIVVNGTSATLDLTTPEVEDCAVIVAGEVWYKMAAFIGTLKMKPASGEGP
jgi:hypothetical protein